MTPRGRKTNTPTRTPTPVVGATATRTPSFTPTATVYITWANPDGSKVNQTATTNTSGVASFSVSGGLGAYTLVINNIAKTGHIFDPLNSVLSRSLTR